MDETYIRGCDDVVAEVAAEFLLALSLPCGLEPVTHDYEGVEAEGGVEDDLALCLSHDGW